MIKDVIIRKEHWPRKKQWDFRFGFRTRPLKGATPLGSRRQKLKPTSRTEWRCRIRSCTYR